MSITDDNIQNALDAPYRERREKIAMHLLAAQMANPSNDDEYARSQVEHAVTVADMLIGEVDRKPVPRRER